MAVQSSSRLVARPVLFHANEARNHIAGNELTGSYFGVSVPSAPPAPPEERGVTAWRRRARYAPLAGSAGCSAPAAGV